MTTYNQDFYKWTQDQVVFLERKEFTKLDIENLIDEVGDLGKSVKRSLKSYLVVLFTHLLKCKYQPDKHSNSWDCSILNSKLKIKDLLKENPSFKHKLQDTINDAYEESRLQAEVETGWPHEMFPDQCIWNLEEILGD